MRWPEPASSHKSGAASPAGTIEVASFLSKLHSSQEANTTSEHPVALGEAERKNENKRLKNPDATKSWRSTLFPYQFADLVKGPSSEVSSGDEFVEEQRDEVEESIKKEVELLVPATTGVPLFSDAVLWRNEKYKKFSDWRVEVLRKTSGEVDTYQVHKLIVGAGLGKSLRIAGDFDSENPPNVTGATVLELEDDLADLVPEVLDWVYHPFIEEHEYRTKSFVKIMILAEYLNIPSLKEKLQQQYMRPEVTVEDLADIWGSFVESKREAERMVLLAAENIKGYVTSKVVDVIKRGDESQMEKLVDDLAPVADNDLILRVMSSKDLMETEKPKKRQHGLGIKPANIRLGRFVAQFCRTHDKVPDKGPIDPTYISGTSVASGLLEQLVDLWTQQYESFSDHASSEYGRFQEKMKSQSSKQFDTIHDQVSALYKQQSKLLEMALNGQLCETFVSEKLCRSSGSLPTWLRVLSSRGGKRQSRQSDPPELHRTHSAYSL